MTKVIFGPMFSGKTTELMRRLKRFQMADYACLIVKYANDNRYSESADICTHDRQTLSAVSATSLQQIAVDADTKDVVGIDEGQFFPDIVEFSELMAAKGKIVIVAALDGTFLREVCRARGSVYSPDLSLVQLQLFKFHNSYQIITGFGRILDLVPLAESIVKLNAVCMSCCGEASFTKRIGTEKQVEVIGGTDKYLAVCRRCYADDNQNKDGNNSGSTPIKTSRSFVKTPVF